MIPDQNVYLANSSVVPYQPVFKQDHLDMSPTPCLLKAFFFFSPQVKYTFLKPRWCKESA